MVAVDWKRRQSAGAHAALSDRCNAQWIRGLSNEWNNGAGVRQWWREAEVEECRITTAACVAGGDGPVGTGKVWRMAGRDEGHGSRQRAAERSERKME